MAMELIGHIDAYSDNSLVGWAVSTSDIKDIKVKAYLNKKLIAECRPSMMRDDIVALYGDGLHGFKLDLPLDLSKKNLFPGFIVKLESQFVSSKALDMNPRIEEAMSAEKIKKEIASFIKKNQNIFVSRNMKTLLRELINVKTLSYDERAVLNRAWDSLEGSYNQPMNGITPVFIRKGTMSGDRSAAIGTEGYIFLEEGSNQIRSQYLLARDAPELLNTIGKWDSLLDARRNRLRSYSTDYVQLCFPEKSSIVGEYGFPRFVGCTPILSLFEDSQKDNETYLPTFEPMLNSEIRTELFYKTDSHPSNRGAYEIFRLILRRLNLEEPFEVSWSDKTEIHAGDIARRLLGVPLYEYTREVVSPELVELDEVRRKVNHITPPGGGHIGTQVEWKNESAPFNKRVLVFGNSFFSAGNTSKELSWWFSNYFTSYRFVWTPQMLEEQVKSYKPDIIVCHTIERFLNQVPAT
ncbi:hypothetical protein AEAC466_18375 [Asticcacaulis sp. AC466]|uniref:hypothetical protein n=1 Tax=Asticcacaulis sp. AC466 TaxID=1282362 RepID=UPI0003C3CDF3|nr:hypothetical protein [Asticcacaulis sp. AC466]ESQ82314.1 hypothetical protein AEAC466_18375 [Asticcacaulis sp. AC466]